ncbi:hypothetical protein Tco_1360257 [Tanacetum coccineum]
MHKNLASPSLLPLQRTDRLGSISLTKVVWFSSITDGSSVIVSRIRKRGRDDFQLTLLRILETITEEPSVIEENHTTFVSEILPSLSVLCKGSKDGDARFLCLKIWFEVVNEAPEDEERRKDLKSICHDHFVSMYPMLMEDEDPTPIYAQKLHQMLVEFDISCNKEVSYFGCDRRMFLVL